LINPHFAQSLKEKPTANDESSDDGLKKKAKRPYVE
jgi:hypothetical protein